MFSGPLKLTPLSEFVNMHSACITVLIGVTLEGGVRSVCWRLTSAGN